MGKSLIKSWISNRPRVNLASDSKKRGIQSIGGLFAMTDKIDWRRIDSVNEERRSNARANGSGKIVAPKLGGLGWLEWNFFVNFSLSLFSSLIAGEFKIKVVKG